MTTHDCDCDKYFEAVKKSYPEDILESWQVSVAPICMASELPGGQEGDAIKGRIHRYVPLPGWDTAGYRVADLWREQPIPARQLVDRRCLASLSEDVGIPVLLTHMVASKTRIKLAELLSKPVDG